ncbi:MAG: lipocalin family protein, partial [Bellilinea sp.]
GFSWMDHEFSTSALGDGQVGWDWFSIQLDDGSELMLFSLRNEDPDIDPDLAGTVIDADGSTHSLSAGEFELSVMDTWRSPANQAEYPAKWRIRILSEEIDITVTPMMANQELHTFFTYWEGAVEISGVRDGKEVSGYGYVELTGYAQSMQGEF